MLQPEHFSIIVPLLAWRGSETENGGSLDQILL
jgi:hypothetical protein